MCASVFCCLFADSYYVCLRKSRVCRLAKKCSEKQRRIDVINKNVHVNAVWVPTASTVTLMTSSTNRRKVTVPIATPYGRLRCSLSSPRVEAEVAGIVYFRQNCLQPSNVRRILRKRKHHSSPSCFPTVPIHLLNHKSKHCGCNLICD